MSARSVLTPLGAEDLSTIEGRDALLAVSERRLAFASHNFLLPIHRSDGGNSHISIREIISRNYARLSLLGVGRAE